MALVRETITWASDEAGLKTYLGVSVATYDLQLRLWLEQAAEEADVYFQLRTWTDDTGADVPHPKGVKVGVYEWVRAVYEWYRSPASGGVRSVKTGQLARTWGAGAGGANLTSGELGFQAAAPHWYRYKPDRLIGGVR